MSVNINMDRFDLNVSLSLINTDDYKINTVGLLNKLEDFLSAIDCYEEVSIFITRVRAEQVGTPNLDTDEHKALIEKDIKERLKGVMSRNYLKE